jgi:hypothetical protein
MPTPECLLYRADRPLASAPTVDVESDGGRVLARVERTRTAQGRALWRWFGHEVEPFAIENESSLRSFLVTRGDGAPFGRIRVRGWLRVRLEAADARAVRLVGQPDGRLCSSDGRELGRLELREPEEALLELHGIADPTQRLLALAMPVCQAANAELLLA